MSSREKEEKMQTRTKFLIGAGVAAAVAVLSVAGLLIASYLDGEETDGTSRVVQNDNGGRSETRPETKQPRTKAQPRQQAEGPGKVTRPETTPRTGGNSEGSVAIPIAKVQVDASSCPNGIRYARIENGVLTGTICGTSTLVPAAGEAAEGNGTDVELENLNPPSSVSVDGRRCGQATYQANEDGSFNLVIPDCSTVEISN